ncbi:hypothetical protein EYR36_005418 [Pleurotus pulmonarius]|nr:hypothetical protein EYR36_005418 [Pleurotus pulmonarius]
MRGIQRERARDNFLRYIFHSGDTEIDYRSGGHGQVAAYARPHNLVYEGKLIEVGGYPDLQYIAVSYAWDPSSVWVQWFGRKVTTQALRIVDRLSRRTKLPIWIDAICIPQDDDSEKQKELPKMADIYRGSMMVVCLISEVDANVCRAVRLSAAIVDTAGYKALERAGDVHGCFSFVTGVDSKALVQLFGSRWWTRAWTFQEAILNGHTFLVGDNDETIPINDCLPIAVVINRKAASTAAFQETVLEKGAPFWSSVAALTVASQRPLTLYEAMAAVWRRQAGVRHDLVYSMLGVCKLDHLVSPNYGLPFDVVLRQLVDASGASGDYSWLRWCAGIRPGDGSDHMRLVPTPEEVSSVSFTGITEWRSAADLPQVAPRVGAQDGVLIHYRSTGVVRSVSASMSLRETVNALVARRYTTAEIWDMLFGLRVGLAEDISSELSNEDISGALVGYLVEVLSGAAKLDGSTSDMAGSYPYTAGYAFTNYVAIAATSWRSDTELVVVVNQNGATVLPASFGLPEPGKQALAHLYELPVERELLEFLSSLSTQAQEAGSFVEFDRMNNRRDDFQVGVWNQTQENRRQ